MTCILSCITDSPTVHRVIRATASCMRALEVPARFVHFGPLAAGGEERLAGLIAAELGAATPIESYPAHPRIDKAVCALASESSATLVIMGARQREGAFKDVAGSTARRVARRASCSVLLVSTAGRDASEWSRFVLGVDCSQTSVEMAAPVLRLARQHALRPSIFFVREILQPELQSVRPMVTRLPIDASVHMSAEQYQLSSFIDGLDTRRMSVTAVVLPGRPGQEIARYAEDAHADLLALLAPQAPLSLLDRLMSHPLLLVLDKLPCSVLLFKAAIPSRV